MNQTKPNDASATADINRQMLEIKKKIQLSEGQRKAAFEDCEAERKSNFEEIQKLKKCIADLQHRLNKASNPTSSIEKYKADLTALIGPFRHKTVKEIAHLIDLQIVDKTKSLDLLQYKTGKRREYLAALGKKHHELQALIEKDAVDKPTKKASCNLQNAIHAVDVQIREASHIAARYAAIGASLRADAARFERRVGALADELRAQRAETRRLQAVTGEAQRMRALARGQLLREERAALAAAGAREREAGEGRRLVAARRQELELLERRICQAAPRARDDEPAAGTDDEAGPETPSQPADALVEAFEVMKQATGAENANDVLGKFKSQKETFERLVVLRKASEVEKKELEKKMDELSTKMEELKFAEVKETERKSAKMEQIEAQINEQKRQSEQARLAAASKRKTIEQIVAKLHQLHLCIKPLTMPSDDHLKTVNGIKTDLRQLLDKIATETAVEAGERGPIEAETEDEGLLPAPYSGLVRRTPVPQPGASPAPPAPPSDDEEDVPSRTYLKRQAQLVVDAKSRRKTIRARN